MSDLVQKGGFDRFVGIDWSGRRGEFQPGIAVAVAYRGSGAPEIIPGRGSEGRWGRSMVRDYLLNECKREDGRTLVGIDFAFAHSFCGGVYYPGSDICADSPATPKTGMHTWHAHMAYAMAAPILTTEARGARAAPQEYMQAVIAGMGEALGADKHYTRSMTMNPMHEAWEALGNPAARYTLGQLHEQTPASAMRKPRQKDIWEREITDGRNAETFRAIFEAGMRYYNRHPEMTAGEIEAWTWGEGMAYTRQHHAEPLPDNEIRHTAAGIGRWAIRNREKYRARFIETQRTRGRRSGEARRAKTTGRDEEIMRMSAEGMTQQAIAEIAGITRQAVAKIIKRETETPARKPAGTREDTQTITMAGITPEKRRRRRGSQAGAGDIIPAPSQTAPARNKHAGAKVIEIAPWHRRRRHEGKDQKDQRERQTQRPPGSPATGAEALGRHRGAGADKAGAGAEEMRHTQRGTRDQQTAAACARRNSRSPNNTQPRIKAEKGKNQSKVASGLPITH